MFSGLRSLGLRSLGLAVLAAAATMGAPSFASAAVISYTGGTYTQGFGTFSGTNGNAITLTNGVTIPGFNTYITARTVSGVPYVAAGPINRMYRGSSYGTNPSTTGTTYLSTSAVYGLNAYSIANNADPSLGFYNSDSNTNPPPSSGYVAAGFTLSNDGTAPLSTLSLTYDFAASVGGTVTATDTLNVSYAINAAGVGDGDGTFTDVPSFASSVTGSAAAVGAGVITGPTGTSITLATPLQVGQTITVRFVDTNISGADSYLKIDNVAIALPEPASLGALGLAGVGMLARRRRSSDAR